MIKNSTFSGSNTSSEMENITNPTKSNANIANNASSYGAVNSNSGTFEIIEDDYISTTLNRVTFLIDPRYRLLRPVGSGAFGTVVSALDQVANEKVAIKKVTRAISDDLDLKRIYREIVLMNFFSHDNIISLRDLMGPPESCSLTELYLVTGLMETDLARIIRSRQNLTEEHVQYFMFQALRGVAYLHDANVIHRDLKPSNLLVNQDCSLKICDLGLARCINFSGYALSPQEKEKEQGVLTEYVVTRWYRAPEVMLCSQSYSRAIDLWSLGCVMAELYTGKCQFPGSDYIHQIRLILNFCGTPSSDTIDFVTNKRAKQFLESLPPTLPADFDACFPKASAEGKDLLKKLLMFDPRKRISAEQALMHPYFDLFRNGKMNPPPLLNRKAPPKLKDDVDGMPRDQVEKNILLMIHHFKNLNRNLRLNQQEQQQHSYRHHNHSHETANKNQGGTNTDNNTNSHPVMNAETQEESTVPAWQQQQDLKAHEMNLKNPFTEEEEFQTEQQVHDYAHKVLDSNLNNQ